MPGIPASDWQPTRATGAGVVATAVYSVAMKIDERVFENQFDDVRFLQGMIEGQKNTSLGKTLAWCLHFGSGVGLANIYAAGAKAFLPGPNWLKGTLFGVLFILAAWILTPLADRYHPLIRAGEMPRLTTKRSFIQNIFRHAVFGLVLGLVYKGK